MGGDQLLGEKFRKELTTESLKELSGIAATRKVYRACGKDPRVIGRLRSH